MEIVSTAPSRIDLAGGTLDIWPLYLYHENALTVNIAIDLYAKAHITTRSDTKVIIESRDTNLSVSVDSIHDLDGLFEPELFIRLIRFYKPTTGFHLITSSDVPPGSGLGGSSAMTIAVSAALNRLTQDRFNNAKIINIAKDIEGQVLKVPPGVQDYYPAVFGGINALWLSVGEIKVEKLHCDVMQLQEKIILYYTGVSRFSGSNNWEIMKKHIDGDRSVFNKLEAIKQTAIVMREAIISNNFDQIGTVLAKEWENRKELVKGVSTKKIEKIIAQAASLGAASAKVCGAGGGGCMIIFIKKGLRKQIEQKVAETGGQVLPFNIDTKGLTLSSFGEYP